MKYNTTKILYTLAAVTLGITLMILMAIFGSKNDSTEEIQKSANLVDVTSQSAIGEGSDADDVSDSMSAALKNQAANTQISTTTNANSGAVGATTNSDDAMTAAIKNQAGQFQNGTSVGTAVVETSSSSDVNAAETATAQTQTDTEQAAAAQAEAERAAAEQAAAAQAEAERAAAEQAATAQAEAERTAAEAAAAAQAEAERVAAEAAAAAQAEAERVAAEQAAAAQAEAERIAAEQAATTPQYVDGNWIYINISNQMNSTYEGVHLFTWTASSQYQWLANHDYYYDDDGVCMYEGRYLVALTRAFGDIGDYVDLLMSDGSVVPVIIVDWKGGYDTYGSYRSDGTTNIIEVIVSRDWYTYGHDNKYFPDVVAYRTE